jgi:hypothetical protein
MPADQVQTDSITTTLPLFPSPRASPREQWIVVVKRAHIVVVGPFVPDDAVIVEIVENLSSRFLMGFGKDCKVSVKDAVSEPNFVTAIDLVGNTIRIFPSATV